MAIKPAALACPTTLEAVVERSTSDSDSCDEHAAKDCALPSCMPVCTAIVAPQGVVAIAKLAPALQIWLDPASVEGLSSGPEPPPPRTVEA
jgi:hypothetical protein